MSNETVRDLESLYRTLLLEVGEDPEREGLLKTPHRASEAMKYVTRGYDESLEDVVNDAIFHETSDDMIVVRDIEFFSLCEHHLFPFFGTVSIGYIPDGRIIGLSKLARITDMYARRLQVQERLTVQIADAVQQTLQPKGVGVVIRAQHLCMMARGVEKQGVEMLSSHVLGVFRSDRATRAEFIELVNGRK